MTYILTDEPEAAGRKKHKITFHNKYYDPSAAPTGKSALTAFLDSDYNWWKGIAENSDRYREEKERCADVVLDALEQGHSDIRSRVEVIDVSTPLTRERYTGNWMGAMQARKPNSNMIESLLQKNPAYAVEGVDGFYLTGQWVEAWGGITTAAQSGRKVIQAMCKRDGKKFSASKA
jgi:phytoene dehydrogenase-like protein